MSIPVNSILKRKDGEIVTIDRSSSVFDTIKKMVEHNVGAILVMDQGQVCGIFTERDYLRRIVLEGRTSKTTRVEEVMTPEVIFVESDYSLDECMAIMTEKKCRHLPVLHKGRLTGIISIGDCVKTLSDHAQLRVRDLTGYITGEYPS